MQLRPLLRRILRFLVIITKNKHQPKLIVVLGDGQTAILRYLCFTAINSYFPARQNLEKPEAEFSVPLAVLDYPYYPKNWRQWLWLVLKSLLQYLSVLPHEHYLVLELNALTTEIEKYWLEALQPDLVLVAGNAELDLSGFNNIQRVKRFSLASYRKIAQRVAAGFGVPADLAEAVLDTVEFPESKLEFRELETKQLLVDARHHYYPMPLGAIVEMFPEEKIEVVDLESAESEIPAGEADVIILLGNKRTKHPLLAKLKLYE